MANMLLIEPTPFTNNKKLALFSRQTTNVQEVLAVALLCDTITAQSFLYPNPGASQSRLEESCLLRQFGQCNSHVALFVEFCHTKSYGLPLSY